MTGHKVFLYALSTCGHCRAVKQFLKDNNIPFDSEDVDMLTGDERKKKVEEVKKYNPRTSFPTLVIDDGKTVIVGHKENDIREALDL